MGYYTDFSLSHDSMIDTERLVDTLYSITWYRWSESLELKSVKWYSWREDMKRVSKKYRGVLFTLSGVGEEREESVDMWVAYFKDGLAQVERAQIIYGDFDPTKLS